MLGCRLTSCKAVSGGERTRYLFPYVVYLDTCCWRWRGAFSSQVAPPFGWLSELVHPVAIREVHLLTETTPRIQESYVSAKKQMQTERGHSTYLVCPRRRPWLAFRDRKRPPDGVQEAEPASQTAWLVDTKAMAFGTSTHVADYRKGGRGTHLCCRPPDRRGSRR